MTRAFAVGLVALAGCSRPAWVAPPPEGRAEDAVGGMLRVWRRAAEEREERFAEALHPGARRAARRARLDGGDLAEYRDQGERLFALDTPWDAADPTATVTPLHARAAPATADATRCQGCHHVGGDGGSGSFGDLALFDGNGDDVLSARRRLPRMLAGAALLERAAAGHDELRPFGWSTGAPRTLSAMVRWSIDTHLAARASDDEADAIAVFIALLPPPVPVAPPRDSLMLRAQRGAELFDQIGCGGCHSEALPVADPVLELASGRRIDLRALLSRDGRPPFEVAARSDLRLHKMGAALAAGEPDHDDRFVTAPLWGVASRGPFLHDGRAATIHEAVLAHGGEAEKARDAYIALGSEQAQLQLYLATLSRAPVMSWVR